MPESFEGMVSELRRDWKKLSGTKHSGTIAVVDLSSSTQSKVDFPAPDIGFERAYRFLEVTRTAATETLGNVFVKFLGDGILIFADEQKAPPVKFVDFTEALTKRIEKLNEDRYSRGLTIHFKCALDFGSNIYVLKNGDPLGTVVDRAFRICSYLVPDMVGASKDFCQRVSSRRKDRFVLAGKAYLKGISDDWQEIYALKGLPGFSLQLSKEQKMKEALTDIWQMGDADRPIWIVSGAIPKMGPDKSILSLHHGDANALIEIVHTLSKTYPDRPFEVVNSEEYLKRNKGSLDNDIVCVSGPSFNTVTGEAMKELRLPLDYEFDETEDIENEKDPILLFRAKGARSIKFETQREDNEIVSDIAVFVKIKGAFAKGRFFYLLMGNQTSGTHAATQLMGISSPALLPNWEFLKTGGLDVNQDRFGLVARTKVLHDFAEPIDLTRRECILKTFDL